MEHYTWVNEELAKPCNQASPFWQAMSLVMAQFEGMMAGYNARVMAEGKDLGIEFIWLGEWLIINTMGKQHMRSGCGLCTLPSQQGQW